MSSGQFSGKVVVVTGSSAGIGKAVALEFASRGAMVTLCGRNETRLQSALNECVQVGKDAGRFIRVAGDVSESGVRSQIVQQTIAKFGRLDVLVANAGVGSSRGDIFQITESEFDRVVNINLKSVIFLIQEAVPYLEKTKGCIISNSSIYSTIVNPAAFIYSLTKASIDHMTRHLAFALGPKGIRVNSFNPGITPTNIINNMEPEIRQKYLNLHGWHPLHGRPSTTEEQAKACVMLASDDAGFVTGQCVKVDAGNTLMGLNWTGFLTDGQSIF